ncbi:hypothetical protein D3C74_287650 [compost metagenome]
MAHHKIHVPLIAQRFRTAVIGHEQHPARVQPMLRMCGDRLRHIMPGGAAAHLGIHAQTDALDHILGCNTLMIAGYAGGGVHRQSPVIRRPGEMPIHHPAGAQGRLNFPEHFTVSVDHTGEVHHFAQRDHILAPGVRLRYLFRSDGRAGCFKFRARRRHTGGDLHVGSQRCSAHLLQHQLNALQTEHVGNLMRVEEAARCPKRKHRPGKFGYGELRALNMAVSVQQSRSDVSSGCFDYPGAFADHVRDIFANIGDASALYRNGHPLQNFTRTDIDQLPPGNDQSGRQIATGGSHKLRHTVRERFSCK